MRSNMLEWNVISHFAHKYMTLNQTRMKALSQISA